MMPYLDRLIICIFLTIVYKFFKKDPHQMSTLVLLRGLRQRGEGGGGGGGCPCLREDMN